MYDNPDDAIAAASRLDLQGDWSASIELYRHAAERWPEYRQYVQHCIDRVTEKQSLAQTLRNSSSSEHEPAQEGDSQVTVRDGGTLAPVGVRGSVFGAVILLAWDIGFTGSFCLSFLTCPVWFFVSILKNAIERPGWRLSLLRIAVPPLVLGFVLANDVIQRDIAKANAARIITACEEFRVDTGQFPETLDELVPQYMPSLPCAKYCLAHGEFQYWGSGESAMLVWCVVPPYYRAIYNFENRRWSYLD